MNFALLSPRVWLELIGVALIAALIWYAYHWAYANGERDANAVYIAQALEQEKAARAKEQGMQTSLENLRDAYIAKQKSYVASAAAAANSLRDLQAGLAIPSGNDPATAIGIDELARTRAVVGSCAGIVQKMAEALDAEESKLIALQSYVSTVLLALNPKK